MCSVNAMCTSTKHDLYVRVRYVVHVHYMYVHMLNCYVCLYIEVHMSISQ